MTAETKTAPVGDLPRLKRQYLETVRSRIMEDLGLANDADPQPRQDRGEHGHRRGGGRPQQPPLPLRTWPPSPARSRASTGPAGP